MADSKFGRLFTEADVLAILDEATMVVPEGFGEGSLDRILATLIERAEADKAPMTFPADEPLFLLRGQDKLAADAVSYYVRQCLFYLERVDPPVSEQHVGDAAEAYQAFKRWQIDNASRVKVPD